MYDKIHYKLKKKKEQELWTSVEFHLFFLYNTVFYVFSKKTLSNTRLKRCSPMFSSKRFINLTFMFNSTLLFKFISMKMWFKSQSSFSFSYRYFLTALFIEKTIPSALTFVGALVKNYMIIYIWLLPRFWI